MVSICTVVHRYLEDPEVILHSKGKFRCWEDLLLDSIARFASSSISEIIIAYSTEPKGRTQTHVGNIPIKRITVDHLSSLTGHALGLHAALEQATSEYVMFVDPDVFFLSDVPSLFVETLNKHNLFVVGINHHFPMNQAFAEFPCAVGMLMRRDQFPPKGWLSGSVFFRYPGLLVSHLQVPGECMDDKWLMFGPPVGHWDKFPNPSGLYDVGCNLWLWNKENNGRWISFGGHIVNSHARLYMANNYHSNFSFTGPWGPQKLLYHKTANGEDSDFVNEYMRL